MFTKLGFKILALRLGRVLGSILYTDQYGIVPGRDIRYTIFVSKHWPNYTSIRQVRWRFSWTLPRLLTVLFGMHWIWFSNILDMGKIFVAGSGPLSVHSVLSHV